MTIGESSKGNLLQTYSLVIPVYNNSGSILELFTQIHSIAESLDGTLELVFVNDGSWDDSEKLIKEHLSNSSYLWRFIAHSRNFGAFVAIQTGFRFATGDYIAFMAADLQEPPKLLIEIFSTLQSKTSQIVVGTRASREDPWLSKLMSQAFWVLYKRYINQSIPTGGVDVFGCNKEVAQILNALPERNTSLIGLLYWIGFDIEEVHYARQKRRHGKSGWTFKKKTKYLTDSIFTFSNLPIRLLNLIGFLGITASFSIGLIVLILKLNSQISNPGYASIVLLITGSTSLILLGLGVLGGYIYRVFENVKGRPSSIIKENSFNKGYLKGS